MLQVYKVMCVSLIFNYLMYKYIYQIVYICFKTQNILFIYRLMILEVHYTTSERYFLWYFGGSWLVIVMVMVLNATFNNISVISWRSALLEEENGVTGEKHWPVASHWQTLSYNVESSTPCLSGIWTQR